MLIRSAVTASVVIAASKTTARRSRRERPELGLLGVFMRTPHRKTNSSRCRLRVADGIVTTGALETFRPAVHYVPINRRGDRLMAPTAGVFDHLMIKFCDLDRVGISPGREIERM